MQTTTTTATFTIERNDNEIELVVTACFGEIEILSVTDELGDEVELSDEETTKAEEAIIKILRKEQEHYEAWCRGVPRHTWLAGLPPRKCR